ncbi:hypothetical protein ABZ829_28155 [Streptomyces xanthochromogenes]|uniref:hypothetical protein n=1 Tax=Streptomyces xanthochromogenes TaxID=67384 RepID=UPI00344A9563
MSAGDARARGDLAEQLLPVAAHLAVLVHGDGGAQDIRHVLGELTATEKEALLVVLAGLVRVDQPLGKLLEWLTFDEHGNLVVPPWEERATLRDLDDEDQGEVWQAGFVDEAAVRQYAAGIAVDVTPRERLEAVVLACAHGLTYLELDAKHGLRAGSTATFVSRARKTFAEWAIPFPEIKHAIAVKPLPGDVVVEMRERYARGGVTDLELAMQYEVTRQTVQRALTGQTHGDVGGPVRELRDRPTESTRVVWARGQAGYATAS